MKVNEAISRKANAKSQVVKERAINADTVIMILPATAVPQEWAEVKSLCVGCSYGLL